MNVIDRWADNRNRARLARWEREHRWDRLGTYNSECSRGIVHTPEYAAEMAMEQRAFDVEMSRAAAEALANFRANKAF